MDLGAFNSKIVRHTYHKSADMLPMNAITEYDESRL